MSKSMDEKPQGVEIKPIMLTNAIGCIITGLWNEDDKKSLFNLYLSSPDFLAGQVRALVIVDRDYFAAVVSAVRSRERGEREGAVN